MDKTDVKKQVKDEAIFVLIKILTELTIKGDKEFGFTAFNAADSLPGSFGVCISNKNRTIDTSIDLEVIVDDPIKWANSIIYNMLKRLDE